MARVHECVAVPQHELIHCCTTASSLGRRHLELYSTCQWRSPIIVHLQGSCFLQQRRNLGSGQIALPKLSNIHVINYQTSPFHPESYSNKRKRTGEEQVVIFIVYKIKYFSNFREWYHVKGRIDGESGSDTSIFSKLSVDLWHRPSTKVDWKLTLKKSWN
jgi:hypothetical protein